MVRVCVVGNDKTGKDGGLCICVTEASGEGYDYKPVKCFCVFLVGYKTLWNSLLQCATIADDRPDRRN